MADTCKGCGKALPAKRPLKHYCSYAHRGAFRARKGFVAKRPRARLAPKQKQGLIPPLLETLYHHINAGEEAVAFNVGETLCRVWLGAGDADPLWHRVNIEELLREKKTPPPRPDKPGKPNGMRVRVCIDGEKDLQILGCGWRIVTIQFRGKHVHLHHNGNTAVIKRDAFRELVAANRRARQPLA